MPQHRKGKFGKADYTKWSILPKILLANVEMEFISDDQFS